MNNIKYSFFILFNLFNLFRIRLQNVYNYYIEMLYFNAFKCGLSRKRNYRLLLLYACCILCTLLLRTIEIIIYKQLNGPNLQRKYHVVYIHVDTGNFSKPIRSDSGKMCNQSIKGALDWMQMIKCIYILYVLATL